MDLGGETGLAGNCQSVGAAFSQVMGNLAPRRLPAAGRIDLQTVCIDAAWGTPRAHVRQAIDWPAESIVRETPAILGWTADGFENRESTGVGSV
jgi:hypothetical protein